MKKMLLLPVLLLSILLSGCDYQAVIDGVINELAHSLTDPAKVVEPFVGFSETEVDDTDLMRKLEPSELEHYVSRYHRYNSYHYFEYLNESEKLLYHAYEYALDEALPYFWVDERLLEGMERTYVDVLEILALDSALVEQNFSISYGGYEVTHTILQVQTASESYASIFVENFSREKLQHKEEAIERSEQILAELMEKEIVTRREQAEYFFDYLGKNVIYETDIPGKEYLYTALCQGKTNCDGFANAMALLCRMSEIPCIELNSDTPEGEEGHTWNVVYLDDRWVHVDATGAEHDVTAECGNQRQERIYFGFPDALLENRIQYADLVPACPDGLTAMIQLPSGDVEDFTEKLKQNFQENDRKVALILVDEGDLEDQITEDLATALDCDLQYIYYETIEGKTVYYLFNDD